MKKSVEAGALFSTILQKLPKNQKYCGKEKQHRFTFSLFVTLARFSQLFLPFNRIIIEKKTHPYWEGTLNIRTEILNIYF